MLFLEGRHTFDTDLRYYILVIRNDDGNALVSVGCDRKAFSYSYRAAYPRPAPLTSS